MADEHISTALQHFQRGQKDAARAACLRILETVPMQFDALHLLGLIEMQDKAYEAGIEKIELAITHATGAVPAELKASAHANLGIAYRRLSRFEDAVESYRRALELTPDSADFLYSMANALADLGRSEEALQCYSRSLEIRPNHVDALLNLANLLSKLERQPEAISYYDRALALAPDNLTLRINRGNAYHQLEKFAEAISDFEFVLEHDPDHALAHFNLANSLTELKMNERALQHLDIAQRFLPNQAELYNSRGNALIPLVRYEEALQSYARALELNPRYVNAHVNLANTLAKLKRFDEAMRAYDTALQLKPDLASAHFDQSMCRFLLGDFEKGLPQYEWRWERKEILRFKRNFGKPRWRGEFPITGKTILLHAEQGLGDTIQFCRYAKRVAAMGARVVLEVQAPLKQLLQGVEGISVLVAKGEALPEFDCHCPLMSLPLALGESLCDIPAEVPYIAADAQLAADLSSRLRQYQGKKIGLCWKGSPSFRGDRERSPGIQLIVPLVQEENACFLSLIPDTREEFLRLSRQTIDLGHEVDAETAPFVETAALMEALDLVITSDTSVAHLAGALGKPLWLVLPYAPDWRWLLEREDCPWYPTAKLFRQTKPRDWSEVVTRVQTELRNYLR